MSGAVTVSRHETSSSWCEAVTPCAGQHSVELKITKLRQGSHLCDELDKHVSAFPNRQIEGDWANLCQGRLPPPAFCSFERSKPCARRRAVSASQVAASTCGWRASTHRYSRFGSLTAARV